MRGSLLAIVAILLTNIGVAQLSLKGIWTGYITADNYNARANYIINIEDHSPNGVLSGKALIYKPNLFAEAYGLQQFFGSIDLQRAIKVSDTHILDVHSPPEYFLCFKLSSLQYTKTDTIERLTGKWNSNDMNCFPGSIHLTRYNSSKDKVPPYILKEIQKEIPLPKFKNTDLSSPRFITVKSRYVDVELKDYLKTDNDTVSVYFNRKLILNKIRIEKKPHKFTITLKKGVLLNEMILYANNLGKEPPNTSMLIIDDGETKQEISIVSTLQKSNVIYFSYKGPEQ
jgi:hypothetical protein